MDSHHNSLYLDEEKKYKLHSDLNLLNHESFKIGMLGFCDNFQKIIHMHLIVQHAPN